MGLILTVTRGDQCTSYPKVKDKAGSISHPCCRRTLHACHMYRSIFIKFCFQSFKPSNTHQMKGRTPIPVSSGSIWSIPRTNFGLATIAVSSRSSCATPLVPRSSSTVRSAAFASAVTINRVKPPDRIVATRACLGVANVLGKLFLVASAVCSVSFHSPSLSTSSRCSSESSCDTAPVRHVQHNRVVHSCLEVFDIV